MDNTMIASDMMAPPIIVNFAKLMQLWSDVLYLHQVALAISACLTVFFKKLH
jgi:hypothetical protein